MNIKIDYHTLVRANERGTNENEIKDVINNGFIIPAKYNRKGKAKVYDYNQNRNGKMYSQKKSGSLLY